MFIVDVTERWQLWQRLWSHAAYQVISGIPATDGYEVVSAGNGWGLRNAADHRRALLIHPASAGSEIGDMALTVSGQGTQVIPRYNRSYTSYLAELQDVVETVARNYL